MGRLLSAICALLLVGCSANHNSIFRTHDVAGKNAGDVSVALIDAKQRAIVSQKDPDEPNRTIVCPEPSPDVFSVLGSALGASGSVGTQNVEAAAAFSRKISEAGASIGLRTQAITAMRDLMFYLCAYYMAGAVNGPHVQAAMQRQGKLLTAIVAIEQLTGAATPATVTVNANAGDVNVSSSLSGKTIKKEESTKTTLRDSEPTGATRQPASTRNGSADNGSERLWLAAEGQATAGGTPPSGQPPSVTPGGGGLVIDTKTDVGSVAAAVTEIVRMVFEDNEVENVCILKFLNNESMDADTRAFCKLNQKVAAARKLTTLKTFDDNVQKSLRDLFKK